MTLAALDEASIALANEVINFSLQGYAVIKNAYI
jgi:hypothetical protein